MDSYKLDWYYHTYEENDYRLHKSQYQGVVDYYEKLGYDCQFDYSWDDEFGGKLYLTVYRPYSKNDGYKDD